MDTKKQIFFTIEGNESMERQEVPADCCIKDFVDEVTKQKGIKDRDGFKVHIEDKNDALGDEIAIIEIPDDKPVHIGRCSRIDVQIHYQDKTETVPVSPGTTIRHLRDKAIELFKPDDYKNKDYELEVTATEKKTDASLPVGTLVTDGTCSVELNLVPAEKWQG